MDIEQAKANTQWIPFDKERMSEAKNDLEWLAVNLTVWKSIFDGMRVFKQGSEASFTSHDDGHRCMQGAEAYTRQQWQNMRYRLGLDTKPHYKLINGQWSGTK